MEDLYSEMERERNKDMRERVKQMAEWGLKKKSFLFWRLSDQLKRLTDRHTDRQTNDACRALLVGKERIVVLFDEFKSQAKEILYGACDQSSECGIDSYQWKRIE